MKNRNWSNSVLTFIVAVLSALFVSCSKEGGDGIASGTSSLNFSADGGTQSLTIVAGSSWSVTDAPSWVTVSPSSGSNGKIQIVVTASRNYETSRRTGTVTLGGADYRMSFSVTQDAAEVSDEISASVSSMSFTANGESMNMSVTSNFSWSTIDKPSWITISPSSGSSGTTSLTITASKSSSTTSRTGTITFGKSSSATVSISVSQAAASNEWVGASKTLSVNGVSFAMIRVDGGTFRMGATSEQISDAYANEKPVHSVTLSTYYIGETEVTQELWQAVMGSNPSNFYGSKFPVEGVNWDDCNSFIKKLNEILDEDFRLPTEAEWEYAARGGSKSKGYKYAGSNSVGNVAWYDVNSNQTTHKVAQKNANELGLYDMSGNVWEWCQDWFGDYTSNSQTNPKGPSSGDYRIVRGCSWYRDIKYCRVSARNSYPPSSRNSTLGLRLAHQ